MKKLFRLLGVVFSAAILAPVVSISASNARPGPLASVRSRAADRIVQIRPLERLMAGGFDGTTTVAQIQQTSDFGIGTFEGLDGEMVMLDGVVYQAPSSGVLRVGKPHEIIPFATLTQFHAEQRFVQSAPLADYPALQSCLNALLPDQNQILAIKIQGAFKKLKIRAPQKQAEPFPTLTEALKTQAVFELSKVKGTFVGFRFPTYVGTMNSAGYHFHFISDDRSIGGHVLEVATGPVAVAVETIEQYDLTLGPAS